MNKKHCYICGEDKQRADFHIRNASYDGLAARCKSCQKIYDKARGMLPHRVAARALYQTSDRGKEVIKKNKKDWEARNSIKRSAHVIVGNAIRDGKLKKLPCEVCGSTKRIHGHHEDYTKPLDVIWLCSTHHNELHKRK